MLADNKLKVKVDMHIYDWIQEEKKWEGQILPHRMTGVVELLSRTIIEITHSKGLVKFKC